MKKISRKEIKTMVEEAVAKALQKLDIAAPSKKAKKAISKASRKVSAKLKDEAKKLAKAEKKSLAKKEKKASKSTSNGTTKVKATEKA